MAARGLADIFPCQWRRHAGEMRDIGGVFFVFQAMPKLQEPAKILSQVLQGKVGLS
jgi:hypothetical protein